MDDAWSSLLLHQKLRPVQRIDARAGGHPDHWSISRRRFCRGPETACWSVDMRRLHGETTQTASRVRTWILALAARHGSTYEVCCVSTGWFADCKIQLYGNACIANLHCKAFFRLLWDIFQMCISSVQTISEHVSSDFLKIHKIYKVLAIFMFLNTCIIEKYSI